MFADNLLNIVSKWPTLADPVMWITFSMVILYGVLVIVCYEQAPWDDTNQRWLKNANQIWCVIACWVIVMWMAYIGMLSHLVIASLGMLGLVA